MKSIELNVLIKIKATKMGHYLENMIPNATSLHKSQQMLCKGKQLKVFKLKNVFIFLQWKLNYI